MYCFLIGMAISSQELGSPLDDESSLGILNLDSMHGKILHSPDCDYHNNNYS